MENYNRFGHWRYISTLIDENFKYLKNDSVENTPGFTKFQQILTCYPFVPSHRNSGYPDFTESEHSPCLGLYRKQSLSHSSPFSTHQRRLPVAVPSSRILRSQDSGVIWLCRCWLDTLYGCRALWCQRDIANQNLLCHHDSYVVLCEWSRRWGRGSSSGSEHLPPTWSWPSKICVLSSFCWSH